MTTIDMRSCQPLGAPECVSRVCWPFGMKSFWSAEETRRSGCDPFPGRGRRFKSGRPHHILLRWNLRFALFSLKSLRIGEFFSVHIMFTPYHFYSQFKPVVFWKYYPRSHISSLQVFRFFHDFLSDILLNIVSMKYGIRCNVATQMSKTSQIYSVTGFGSSKAFSLSARLLKSSEDL